MSEVSKRLDDLAWEMFGLRRGDFGQESDEALRARCEERAHGPRYDELSAGSASETSRWDHDHLGRIAAATVGECAVGTLTINGQPVGSGEVFVAFDDGNGWKILEANDPRAAIIKASMGAESTPITECDCADLMNVSAHKPKPTVHPTQYRRAPNGRGYRVLDTSSELALMRQDDGLRVTAPLATVATWTLEDGPEAMTLAEQHEARGRLALEWPREGETRTETLRRVTGSVELPPAWMWESGQPSPWKGAVRL